MKSKLAAIMERAERNPPRMRTGLLPALSINQPLAYEVSILPIHVIEKTNPDRAAFPESSKTASEPMSEVI